MKKSNIKSVREGQPIYCYAIYTQPDNAKSPFVVRRTHITSNAAKPAGEEYADTFTEARGKVPAGLVCMRRMPDDEPALIETWI